MPQQAQPYRDAPGFPDPRRGGGPLPPEAFYEPTPAPPTPIQVPPTGENIYATQLPTGGAVVAEVGSGLTAGVVRPEAFQWPPHPLWEAYGLSAKTFGPSMETATRLAKDFPELEQEIAHVTALQALSKQRETTNFPEGATKEGYATARRELYEQTLKEVVGDNEWYPKEMEFEAERRAALQAIPGVHKPAMTDEEVEELITGWMEAQTAGRQEKFREEHPWLATGTQTIAGLPTFLGVLGLVGKGMRAVPGMARIGTAGGGAVQMGTTELGLQGARAFTGTGKVDPYSIAVSMVSGALGAKAAHSYLQKRMGKYEELANALPKWAGGKMTTAQSKQLIAKAFGRAQKTAGSVDLLTDFASDEFLMAMGRAVTGEKDEESIVQKLIRGLLTFGGGRFAGKVLTATRTTGGVRTSAKEGKKSVAAPTAEGKKLAKADASGHPDVVLGKTRVRGTFDGKVVEGVAETSRTSKAGVEHLGVRVGDELLGLRRDAVEVLPQTVSRPKPRTVTQKIEKPSPAKVPSVLAAPTPPTPKKTKTPRPADFHSVVRTVALMSKRAVAKWGRSEQMLAEQGRQDPRFKAYEKRLGREVKLQEYLDFDRDRKLLSPMVGSPELQSSAAVIRSMNLLDTIAKKYPELAPAAMKRKALDHVSLSKRKFSDQQISRMQVEGVKSQAKALAGLQEAARLKSEQLKAKKVLKRAEAKARRAKAREARKPKLKAKLAGKTKVERETRRRAVESNVVGSHTDVDTAIRELRNASKRVAATDKQRGELKEIEIALRRTRTALEKTSDAKDSAALHKSLVGAMKAAKAAWSKIPKQTPRKKGRGSQAGAVLIPSPSEIAVALADTGRRLRAAIVKLYHAVANMKEAFHDRPRGPKTRAISALHFAPRAMSAAGMLSPTQMAKLRAQIENGDIKVRKVRADDWKSVEIELSDGSEIKLWDPDSTEMLSELAREIAPPSARQEGKTRRAREDAAELAIVHYLRTGLAAQTREHFINVGSAIDHAFNLQGRPHLPRKMARLIGVELLDSVENALFHDLEITHRAEISRKMDEAKEIAFQARKLLDFEGGAELSEMMWDNLTGGPKINPSEFPNADMAKAYELIKRIRDLYAWTGRVFYRNGLLSEETYQKYKESGTYSMRFYDHRNRLDTNALYATMYKDWLHEQGGPSPHRILSPGSVVRAMGSFLRGRSLTKEQAIAAGTDTSITRSIQGTLKQIETAAQLRMYERLVEDESGLVRTSIEDLPKSEVARRAAEERARKRLRGLTEAMVARRIPLYLIEEGGQESKEQRVSRGAAWRKYNTKLNQAIEDGLYAIPPGERNRAQRARIKTVDALADAAFGVTDFRRVPFIAEALKKPKLQPQFAVDSPVTIKWNKARTEALAAVRRIADVAYRYKHVPDKPQYGAIKGMYVHRAVWDELRQSASLSSGIAAFYEAVHMTGKKFLTAYNPATFVTNVTGNIMYNSMAGVQLTHPDTAKVLWYATKAITGYRATGTILPANRRDIALATKEFFESGMVESSQAAIELTKYSGGSRLAAARAEKAIDEQRTLDALGHLFQSWVIGVDDAILRTNELAAKGLGTATRAVVPGKVGKVLGKGAESLTLGKLQDRYYDSDTIQAMALYISLRTGLGNVRTRGSSAEYSMAVTSSWYNYRQVPKPLKSGLGRGFGSFARFAWKSKTGVAMAALTTPMMLPIVPQGAIAAAVGKVSPAAGKKVQGASIKPSTLRRVTPEGQKAALIASSTTIMGLKIAGALSAYALADYLGKLYSGMSEEEWEKSRTAATRDADPIREIFQLPVTIPTQVPWFWDLERADPLAQVARSFVGDPYVAGGIGTKAIRWVSSQNIFLSKVYQMARGEDYFGHPTDSVDQALNVGAVLAPNILYRNIFEIYKHVTGRTSKTGLQSFLQALGIKMTPGDPREYPRAMKERLKDQGEYREIVVLTVDDPTNTEARKFLRQADEFDKLKRAERQIEEDRSR